MGSLKREDIPAPQVRRERVTLASLGGDVIVRGLLLEDSLLLSRLSSQPVVPMEGESEVDANTRNGARVMAQMLHLQVVLEADDKPVWSVEQWQTWAGTNTTEFFQLYRAALRVSGADEEVALKNS